MVEPHRDDGNSCLPELPRRGVLRMLAGFGAAGLLRGRISAQDNAAAPGSGWVDVHHHLSPPSYAEALVEHDALPKPMAGWSVEKSLADMDEAGVATAFNSIVVPGVWFGDAGKARRLARECNEYGAKLVSDFPGRFGNFATVTVPDIDGSLKEAEYALDTLKADGILLFTSYGDKWLGDPMFAPLFEELDRRRAIVFVHPTSNACCANLLPIFCRGNRIWDRHHTSDCAHGLQRIGFALPQHTHDFFPRRRHDALSHRALCKSRIAGLGNPGSAQFPG